MCRYYKSSKYSEANFRFLFSLSSSSFRAHFFTEVRGGLHVILIRCFFLFFFCLLLIFKYYYYYYVHDAEKFLFIIIRFLESPCCFFLLGFIKRPRIVISPTPQGSKHRKPPSLIII